MKQLTKNQIQELFDFTKSHRVRYYDLQSELVDHLASAIENRWINQPEIPFKTALNQVYADFGIYGFGKLEQEKMEIIQRRIARKVWAFVKSYLTIPKVGLTLLLIVLTYLGLSLFSEPQNIAIGIVFLLLTLFSIGVYRQRVKNQPLLEQFLEVKGVLTGGNVFMLLFIFPVQSIMILEDATIPLWGLSVFLVFFVLTLVGTYQYCLKTVEEVKLQYVV